MTFCQDIYKTLCIRHPNRNIFIIGDQHFYHNHIIEYTRGEFKSLEDMHKFIIGRHNETVGKEDVVIFLGDFCFKRSFIKDILKNLNGHKYLVLGNHDPDNLERAYPELGFEGVYIMPVKIGSNFLSHEPLVKGDSFPLTFQQITKEFIEYTGATNYHGHIHSTEGNISQSYQNVTCENVGYKPLFIGKTTRTRKENRPLFINSEYFEKAISSLYEKFAIDPGLLFNDYLYSTMLEYLSPYSQRFFLQGSYGLLKKYGYISKVSDLDISVLFDPQKSLRVNYSETRSMADRVYEQLKCIQGINLEFLKRYKTLRIFRSSLAKANYLYGEAALDMNMIPLDCYREQDFRKSTRDGESILEKCLRKVDPSSLTEYQFPKYNVNMLTPTGDIVNLILQILFQEGREDVKINALKKLQYVYKHNLQNDIFANFLDTFIRLFLRNVTLLSEWDRFDEIDCIKEKRNKLESLIKSSIEPYIRNMPSDLINQIYEVLLNPNSPFLKVYDEMVGTPNKNFRETSTMILKEIK